MKFTQTKLQGAFIIELEKREDERGFFARFFGKNELKKIGVNIDIVQMNISANPKEGTLRGMHYQKHPFQEVKIVSCIKGAVYDVIIDLRKDSPTYKKWFGVELSAKNRRQLYIPKDFAHGYLTLKNNSEVLYLVSEYYTPNSEGGLRFDDPIFRIKWPTQIKIISEKDKSWEDFH